MALYNVLLPGYFGGGFDPSKITGGARLTAEPPVTGTMFAGVNAASVAAAAAAIQAALPATNQAALMHVWLTSNDSTA